MAGSTKSNQSGLFGTTTESKSPGVTSPRGSVVALAEMQDGQMADCFVLLTDKEARKTRGGKPFFTLTVRDRTRTVSVPVWSDSEFFSACELEWTPGQFFKVRGTFRNTDWGPQLELERIRQVTDDDRRDGFDPIEFCERTRFDVDAMFLELCELARQHIRDTPLASLVVKVLERYEAGIKAIPAATHNHHAFVGGYLEHVRSVTRTAVYLADKYADYYADLAPPISKSVIVAGAILHDVGKLRELDASGSRTVYSVAGRLLGHMVLGRDIVREEAATVEGLSPETQLHLEHIIAAHQGTREWGAVVEPHTIECMIVHYADDLDAKVNMAAQSLAKDSTPGPFTSRENPLRRPLLKRAELSKEATNR